MICFLANLFLLLVFFYFIFFLFLLICRYEYSREDRLAFIEVKLDFLIHHLDPRIHNDSLMEQGVLLYQESSNPTFQEEEELSLVKEQIFIYMDGNKKMISLHEQKFPDLDAFQVNTSARLKNVEAQIGYLVQAFK